MFAVIIGAACQHQRGWLLWIRARGQREAAPRENPKNYEKEGQLSKDNLLRKNSLYGDTFEYAVSIIEASLGIDVWSIAIS